MNKITIAGSSVGGSSYLRRIVNALLAGHDELHIFIEKGKAQNAVHRVVTQELLDLHTLVAKSGGAIKTKIRVECE